MTNFTFWNLWHHQNKVLYLILLALSILVAIAYVFAVYLGPDSAIDWKVFNHWEKFGVLVDGFQVALFDFEIFADNYVVTESFSASPISVNYYAVYGYLLILGLGLSLLLAVITVLPRFWYIAGMAFFIFFVTNFKLEQLQLFGRTDFTALIFVFLMYLPFSYFIHAIRPDVRFLYRILTFVVITLIVSLIIGFFSAIDHPWLYLANYGIAGPVILSLIFIFLVSHEIIAAFLFLITNYNSTYSKNSLLHFAALSLIYLFNVLLAYFHSRAAIDWDIIYINAFILLLVSALVGIWGFKKRSELFNNMIPMNGPGEVLYLSLGLICFATIGYLFLSINDPILETFEDAIIFTHFGFGLFFFIYILVNFMTLLVENMRVYRVVYKPVRMPYIMSNVGGLAVVVLFLFRANLYPYSQAVSGYFNGIGDVYVIENDLFLAEQYYKLGSGYGFQNHKSNYSLASLAVRQNDHATGLFYFKEALAKHPSEYAYVNLANIYKDNARIFDAVFTLKEGMDIFPDSGPIKNNLALLYNKLNMNDSSLIVLEDAIHHKASKNAAQTNALAIYAKSGKSTNPDTVKAFFEKSEYIPVLANKVVINNQERVPISQLFNDYIFQDSLLGLNKYSYLNNYTFNTYFEQDTSLEDVITRLQFHPSNLTFQENLDFLKSMHAYFHNDVAAAFKYMDNLQSTSLHEAGYYNYILGVWAMEQKSPLLAAGFFAKAAEKGIEEATILNGVALSMSGNTDNAREKWSSLLYDENPDVVLTASNMLKVLNMDRDLTLPEEDETFIYRALLFNHPQLSEPEIQDMLDQSHSLNYKADALVSIIKHNIKNKDKDKAAFYLEKLKRLNINNDGIKNEILWSEAEILAIGNQIQNLKTISQQLTPRTKHQKFLHLYFQALILESNNQADEASIHFQQLAYKNPFFESGVIAASNHFRKQGDALKVYDILRHAVEINSTSKELLEQFIIAALELGLNIYAESALEDYEKLASENEYKNFFKIYNTKMEELKQENSGWD